MPPFLTRPLLATILLGTGCSPQGHEAFSEGPDRFRIIRQSLYNQIIVERDGNLVDLRFQTGHRVPRQTAVDLSDPERLVIPYTRTMLAAALVQPEPRRILQIGLGGGALNRYLRLAWPEAHLTTVELDGAVRDVAVEYMGFQPDGHDRVVIEDGRAFVRKNSDFWDWILVDAYREGTVPPHLKTREFYTLLKNRLAPGGVVALNLHRGNRLFASDQATLRAVFSEVHLFTVPGTGNAIALAFPGSAPDFAAINPEHPIPQGSHAKTLHDHLTQAARNHAGAVTESGASVLTDDYSPAEFLQNQATE